MPGHGYPRPGRSHAGRNHAVCGSSAPGPPLCSPAPTYARRTRPARPTGVSTRHNPRRRLHRIELAIRRYPTFSNTNAIVDRSYATLQQHATPAKVEIDAASGECPRPCSPLELSREGDGPSRTIHKVSPCFHAGVSTSLSNPVFSVEREITAQFAKVPPRLLDHSDPARRVRVDFPIVSATCQAIPDKLPCPNSWNPGVFAFGKWHVLPTDFGKTCWRLPIADRSRPSSEKLRHYLRFPSLGPRRANQNLSHQGRRASIE